MTMPGRGGRLETAQYRYGYQGSEKNIETDNGGGNQYTTEFRQLDARFGRWFSTDPKFFPYQSPYNSMDGNPINITDVMGAGPDGGAFKQEDYFDSYNIGDRKVGVFINEGGQMQRNIFTKEGGYLYSQIFNKETGWGEAQYMRVSAYGLDEVLVTLDSPLTRRKKELFRQAWEESRANNFALPNLDIDDLQLFLDGVAIMMPGPIAAAIEGLNIAIDIAQEDYTEAAVRVAVVAITATLGKAASKAAEKAVRKAMQMRNASKAKNVIAAGDNVVESATKADDVAEQVVKKVDETTSQSNEVVKQTEKTVEEVAEKSGTSVAQKAEKLYSGPWISKYLDGGKGYNSFNGFKRVNGKAGNGNAWHHIVEQHASNINKFGKTNIHNTKNLIKLNDKAGQIHRKITGHYNSYLPGTKTKVRDWIKTKSFDEQYEYGVKIMRQFGYTGPL